MGAASAGTFEWAGNSAGVLRSEAGGGGGASKGKGLWNRGRRDPGNGRVRQVLTLPGSGPESPEEVRRPS